MKQFAPQKECLDLGNNDENQEFDSTRQRKQELFGNSEIQSSMETGRGDSGASSDSWGTALASFNGVTAYSNGASSGVHANSYQTAEGETRYGLKYQCVEYVNRYSALVNGTGNMSGTGNAHSYSGTRGFGYTWVQNKKDDNLPDAGDIIVFKGGSWGHVAIATSSSASSVGIIQQNTKSARSSIGVKEGKLQNWGGMDIVGWQTQGSVQESRSSVLPGISVSTPETQAPKAASSDRYTVQAGDSLWQIAARELGDGARYTEISALNNISNPGSISVGQVLILREGNSVEVQDEERSAQKDKKATLCFASTSNNGILSSQSEDEAIQKLSKGFQTLSPEATNKNRDYTVKRGETLWEIAMQELGDGNRYNEIVALSNISDPSLINIGDRLILPT